MAGYIMTMGDVGQLRDTISRGSYGTLLSPPSGTWLQHHEGTFADFATMREGDEVYFFSDRRLYGIGRLTPVAGEVVHANTEDAHVPEPLGAEVRQLLPSPIPEREIRWLCTFAPDPRFFQDGVDMDDVLESNPAAFRMLRVLWKLSFVKVDDVESQALRDVFLRRAHLRSGAVEAAPSLTSRHEHEHGRIASDRRPVHDLSPQDLLAACADGPVVRHEMALEAGLLYQLSREEVDTVARFGRWDYLTHQVPASPFKPVDYMDRMDVFGYRYVPGHHPTIARYLVAELKREVATAADVQQALKYVDWIRSEYASGDYEMVEAFLVAARFDDSALDAARRDAERRYTVGRRPPESRIWRNLNLLTYRFEPDGRLSFAAVEL